MTTRKTDKPHIIRSKRGTAYESILHDLTKTRTDVDGSAEVQAPWEDCLGLIDSLGTGLLGEDFDAPGIPRLEAILKKRDELFDWLLKIRNENGDKHVRYGANITLFLNAAREAVRKGDAKDAADYVSVAMFVGLYALLEQMELPLRIGLAQIHSGKSGKSAKRSARVKAPVWRWMANSYWGKNPSASINSAARWVSQEFATLTGEKAAPNTIRKYLKKTPSHS